MKRGQKTGAEQVVLKLRQIEVQTAQGKSLALACKEAEISEQSYKDECLTPGDLLLAEGGTDRDRDLAEHLQPRPTAFVVGLPAARACHLPGSGLPATHGRHHAVASQLARSKIPVRSLLHGSQSRRVGNLLLLRELYPNVTLLSPLDSG